MHAIGVRKERLWSELVVELDILMNWLILRRRYFLGGRKVNVSSQYIGELSFESQFITMRIECLQIVPQVRQPSWTRACGYLSRTDSS